MSRVRVLACVPNLFLQRRLSSPADLGIIIFDLAYHRRSPEKRGQKNKISGMKSTNGGEIRRRGGGFFQEVGKGIVGERGEKDASLSNSH